MNNSNVVKIGNALKWRSTFDPKKKYYQENIITFCGSVFRCKVLCAQGIPPAKQIDDLGHIAYINDDTWDVVVDMAYYYNFAIDTNKVSEEALQYVKEIEKHFQRQQEEIDRINRHNAEQQRELDSLLDFLSCFSEGIWDDALLWSNITIWDNNKYELTDKLTADLASLKQKHLEDFNRISSTLNSYFNSIKVLDSQVNDLLFELNCIYDGRWVNGLKWSNESLWNSDNEQTLQNERISHLESFFSCFSGDKWNSTYLWNNGDYWTNERVCVSDIIADVRQDVQVHDKKINDLEALSSQLSSSIKSHEDKLSQHQKQLQEQQVMLETILSSLSVVSAGSWNNSLFWYNEALWSDGNKWLTNKITAKSYNLETSTITLNPVPYYYDKTDDSLGFSNVEHQYIPDSDVLQF